MHCSTGISLVLGNPLRKNNTDSDLFTPFPEQYK